MISTLGCDGDLPLAHYPLRSPDAMAGSTSSSGYLTLSEQSSTIAGLSSRSPTIDDRMSDIARDDMECVSQQVNIIILPAKV